MKAGCCDYVMKDKLDRLDVAIERELRDARTRYERKLTEEALRQSEEKFRILFESSRDALMTLGPPSWAFTSGNPAMVEMFRAKSEEEFISYTPVDLSPEQQPDGSASSEKAGQMIETAMREGSHSFEWTYKRLNGEEFPATVLLTRIEVAGKRFLQATVRDITWQKQAEEALKESEEKFRNVFGNSNVGKSITLPGGRVNVNRAFCEMLGYAKEELSDKKWQQLTHPDDIELTQKNIDEILSGQKESARFTKRYIKRNGDVIWADLGTALQRDGKGKPLYFITSVIDITQRKKGEEELVKSKMLLESVFSSSQDLIAVVDRDLRILKSNWKTPLYDGCTEFPIGSHCYEAFIHRDTPCEPCHPFGVFNTGKPIVVEYYNQYTKLFKEVSAYPIFDNNNNVIMVVENVHDITERKQAEDALRQSEARYRILFEQAADIILQMEITPQGMPVIQDANNATLRLLGYERDELIGKPVSFIEATPDASKVISERRHNILSGTGTVFETRHRCKDGTVRDFECSVSEIHVGTKNFAISFERDITERKKVEEKLSKSEEKYRSIFENVQDVYYEAALDGTIIEVSPSIEIISKGQYHRDDLIGKSMYEFYYDAGERQALLKALQERGSVTDFEVTLKNRDGSLIPCSISSKILFNAQGNPEKITGSMRDITKRNRAEQELRESKALVDAVVENVPLMISIKEATDLRFVIFNRAGEELLGYDRTALLGKNNLDLFPPEQAAHFMAKDREALDGEAGMLDIPEEPIQTAKNGQRLLHTRKVCISGEDGTTKYLLGISEDITERKQAEAALRESEERYRTLFDDAKDGIALADVETGRIVECNHALCAMVGMDKAELVGQMQSVINPPQGLANGQPTIFAQHTAGDPGMIAEEQLISKTGALTPVEIKASRVQMNGRDYMLGIFRDVSERKQHENEKEKLLAQLLQAQKMEAIGTLAGGVAHDFNNLLTAISGFTTMAMMKMDESDPVQRDLKQVSIAATRAAGLTRQLLLFSRKQHMEPAPMDPNATISRLLKMLGRLIGEDIIIETSLEKDLWSILGDEGNVEQVLMNLSVNARDAMPGGGKLFIKTENVTIDEEYCRACNAGRPGRFVCLSISDTGTGMDELTQEHIFEPFFTTKGEGKGTGLGLSVVLGIVQQHKGWVNVYSEPGHGATFKVYFPSTSEAPEQQSTKDASLVSLLGKGERIMVVEDQAEVRELAKEILTTNGYSVFPVSGAKEAIDLFENENGRFDLVFSDVVLADTSGVLLVEGLLKRWKFKVIITSGYTDEKANWDFIKEKKYRFLHKPYAMQGLLMAVKDVLADKKS
jgi:PAS domain S-box-containing protein